MKIRLFSICYLLSILVFLPLLTQADEYVAESDFFGESPVVLTVSRMNKSLSESPASVTVVDRQMIRNSGAREIADIFRLVPGFIVGYHSGHSPVVTYQGLGHLWHRQMQVLIDGRSVFIPSFGGVPWSNLPLQLEDIERVEVTRGPNAVTYGANAFLATINIITRHAAEDLGSKLTVTHDLDKDSNAQDIYFRYGNNYGDLDWRITAGREKDDGYEFEHDSKLLEKLNIRTDFLTAYNQFWTVQAGINNSTFGRGDGDVTALIRDEIASNSYQNIQWEIIEDDSNTKFKLTHANQDVDDRYDTDPLNNFLATELNQPAFLALPDFYADVNFNRESDRLDLEIYQSRNISRRTTLVYGGSIRKDEVTAFYLFNDNDKHEVDTKRLFSSIEWKSDTGFIADFGIMSEDTNFTKQEESYRLSLIQKMGGHNLRLVSSTAKRNPILWEKIGETQFVVDLPSGLPAPYDQPIPLVIFRATESIKPESIQSSEIGLFSEYFNRQLSTDIKLFSYTIFDQITEQTITLSPDPITGIDQMFGTAINGNKTIVDGLELSINFSPKHKEYRLYGGLSLVDVKSFDVEYEESIPGSTAFVSGHFEIHPGHQFSTNLYYVNNFSWTDSKDQLESYKKLDLRYQITIDQKNDLKLELIGYNLLQDHEDYFLKNQQEETFLLRISGRF